jgi:hypothetical protein
VQMLAISDAKLAAELDELRAEGRG